MRGACLNAGMPYECEWSIGDLWYWSNWISRLDVILLALMFAYSVFVFFRVSHHLRLVQRTIEVDFNRRSLRKLAVDLNTKVGNLKAIATAAPYLGLAGTSFGIMSMFRGFVGERGEVQATLISIVSVALVTAAAGILVAVAAICYQNYLPTRVDSLERELTVEATAKGSRQSHNARRFPLARRFSQPPAFALIATPCLAMAVAGFISIASFRLPMGLEVELAPPARCGLDHVDRFIVLRVTNACEIFLNSDRQDWSTLSGRLSEIYAMREDRTLYFVAEDDAPFQTAADAIDIADNAQLTVRLITPAATKTPCLPPIATRTGQTASK